MSRDCVRSGCGLVLRHTKLAGTYERTALSGHHSIGFLVTRLSCAPKFRMLECGRSVLPLKWEYMRSIAHIMHIWR